MPAPEAAFPLPLQQNGEKPQLKPPFISKGTGKRGKAVAQPPPSASVSSVPSTGRTDPASHGHGNAPSCAQGTQNPPSGFASIGGGEVKGKIKKKKNNNRNIARLQLKGEFESYRSFIMGLSYPKMWHVAERSVWHAVIEARSHQQRSYPNKARVKSLPQKVPKSCV